jgi:hypothetical protein
MRNLPILLMASTLALAGCTGGSTKDSQDGDSIDVTPQTGGLRGIVVDGAIKPIEGATVVLSVGRNATTDASGQFLFTGLPAGDYFIQALKPGYRSSSSSGTVVAGDANPPVHKILLERIATAQPYVDTLRLDGFYECAFALFFITDGCDFGYRTAYDASPQQPPQPVPRTIQKFTNTQFLAVPADTFTIVQEAFWKDPAVSTFWIMVDKTPISNSCDCSDTYSNAVGTPGLLNRIEKYAPDGTLNTKFRNDMPSWSKSVGIFPTDVTVASRGFVPPPKEATGVNYALNMQFTVLTTLFHNTPAPEGWTFETRSQYKIG